jgi:phage terminase small subunit
MPTGRPPLTARHVRFCQLWAEKGNAYQSYLDAGFPPGASRNATDQRVALLLRNPHIVEYVRQIQHDAAHAAGVTLEWLARGFKGAVDADLTRLMGPDGEMLPPSEWPADVRRHIVAVDVEELTEMVPDPDNPRKRKKVAVGTRWKVKLENKTECRKVLATWRRMIGDDKETGKAAPAPLVIGGEADLNRLKGPAGKS